jgi:hypothetical protein
VTPEDFTTRKVGTRNQITNVAVTGRGDVDTAASWPTHSRPIQKSSDNVAERHIGDGQANAGTKETVFWIARPTQVSYRLIVVRKHQAQL